VVCRDFSAGIYLPLEFQHFAHHATILNADVIFFNLVVVLYLAKLLIRQRAERHAASQRDADTKEGFVLAAQPVTLGPHLDQLGEHSPAAMGTSFSR
jgi:hypothetical protein